MFIVVERHSSSTSTDSGLHLQEKIKGNWPLKGLSKSIILVIYSLTFDYYFIYII